MIEIKEKCILAICLRENAEGFFEELAITFDLFEGQVENDSTPSSMYLSPSKEKSTISCIKTLYKTIKLFMDTTDLLIISEKGENLKEKLDTLFRVIHKKSPQFRERSLDKVYNQAKAKAGKNFNSKPYFEVFQKTHQDLNSLSESIFNAAKYYLINNSKVH